MSEKQFSAEQLTQGAAGYSLLLNVVATTIAGIDGMPVPDRADLRSHHILIAIRTQVARVLQTEDYPPHVTPLVNQALETFESLVRKAHQS